MKVGKLSAEQLFRAQQEAEAVNKSVNHGRPGKKNELGKDSFLKLLVTQLKYQDPTRPMEDREFISQMAQFSSLEQMTNMNKEMMTLVKSTRSSEAFSLLGKYVDAMNPSTNKRVSGMITSIEFRDDGQVLKVGNEEITVNDIHAVHDTAAAQIYQGAAAQNGPVKTADPYAAGAETKQNRDSVQTK